jgi:hypothetical protein
MSFHEFKKQFQELSFLPKGEHYRTLRIAEFLEDADRSTLLDALSVMNDDFAELAEKQSKILSELEAFLHEAKKKFHKIKNYFQEGKERSEELQSFESKLQHI